MKRALFVIVALALASCSRQPTGQHGLPPGFTLASKTIALPDDRVALPTKGSGAALLTQSCTGCHSAEMLTAQPRLDAKTWAAEVAKMRTVYHAPVDPADDPKLVAALMTLPTQRTTTEAPR